MSEEEIQGIQCDLKVDFSEISDLCEIMPQPLLTTGIFIKWMRTHFADADKIELDVVKEFTWDDDIANTNIIIDSVFRFNAAQTETRPGIFVKRNNWEVVRMGIDDRKLFRTNDPNWQQYITFYKGSHTLFCVAGESAEVELLATEVYRELVMAGPRARSVFNFLRFTVAEIGEPAILEEATENFVVPITVAYAGQDVWQICC